MGLFFVAVLFGLLWWSWYRLLRIRQAGILTGPECLGAALAVSVGLLSLLGIVLAFAGQFRTPWVVSGLLLLAAAPHLAIGRGQRGAAAASGPDRPARSRDLPTLGAGALMLVAGAVLYSGPGENLVGAWDPGVYLATGSHIARHGSWLIRDSASPRFTPEEKEATYGRIHGRQVKYPGFYVDGRRPHTLQPQFYPLYPVSIAGLALAGGLEWGLYAGSVFAWLSLLMLLLAGRELGGRLGALIAGTVFLLNPVQVWFSGFQTAELAMQFFFLAGLWLWTLWHRTSSRAAAAAAGSMFALTAFTSITGALLALLAAAGHLLTLWNRRTGLLFYAPLPLLLLLFLYQNTAMTSHYFTSVGWGIRLSRNVILRDPRLVLTVAVGLPALILLLRYGQEGTPILRRVRTVGAAALAVAVLLALGKALYGGDLVQSRWLAPAAMLSKTGVLFSFAGMGIAAWRRPAVLPVAVVVPLVFTYVFFRNSMMTPVYPWAFKRLLAVTLPAAALFIGCFWARAATLVKRRGYTVAVLMVAALMIARPAYRGRDFALQRDWRGFVSYLQELNAAIPEGGVVLARRHLAPALEFVCGRTVFPVYKNDETEGARRELNAAVLRSLDRGVAVYAVRDGRDDWGLPFAAAAVGDVRLDSSILEQSRMPFENRVKSRRLRTVVERLGPRGPGEGGADP